MNLRDEVWDLCKRVQADGSKVIAVEAVRQVVDRYDEQQKRRSRRRWR